MDKLTRLKIELELLNELGGVEPGDKGVYPGRLLRSYHRKVSQIRQALAEEYELSPEDLAPGWAYPPPEESEPSEDPESHGQ